MKELRPGSAGKSEIRILFVFDPVRRAVLLVAGDKSRNWNSWYRNNIRAEARAFQLAEVRREQELTQQDVAGSMGVSIPRVSAIERGEVDRVEVSTLRAYIEALGGRLQIIAEFGDSMYRVA